MTEHLLLPPNLVESQLLDDRRAFDSVAGDYDGPVGNNALIQRMRRAMWQTVTALVPRGSRLLDLGCGTGIDAVHFVSSGYKVHAIDWSPRMVARTCERAKTEGFEVQAAVVGLHELEKLGNETFEAIYSDLGPLNCVHDLEHVSANCARLLSSEGLLMASVIGRTCPWEFAYYGARGDWNRARLRGGNNFVPVNLNGYTVWTRYYSPREFYKAFDRDFVLIGYRPLGLFSPPPYLIGPFERHQGLFFPLFWADEHLGRLPILRDAGDHFIAVLRRRN